jgi:hypothetical protein
LVLLSASLTVVRRSHTLTNSPGSTVCAGRFAPLDGTDPRPMRQARDEKPPPDWPPLKWRLAACVGHIKRRKIVAETHVSTPCAQPSQKARLPRTHEERGRTEGSCPTPEKRTPQPHAGLMRRGSIFLAPAVWCAAPNTMRCTGTAGGEPAASSPFFFARMASLTAASAGASRRRWAAQSGAIVSDAGFARS